MPTIPTIIIIIITRWNTHHNHHYCNQVGGVVATIFLLCVALIAITLNLQPPHSTGWSSSSSYHLHTVIISWSYCHKVISFSVCSYITLSTPCPFFHISMRSNLPPPPPSPPLPFLTWWDFRFLLLNISHRSTTNDIHLYPEIIFTGFIFSRFWSQLKSAEFEQILAWGEMTNITKHSNVSGGTVL